MYYKELHRTVEELTSYQYESEHQMLTYVLNELIKDTSTAITGGRIWKLDKTAKSYRLTYQAGTMNKLEEGYNLPISEYPFFSSFIVERTLLGSETHPKLREMGIFQFAASGIGNRMFIDNHPFYEFILAFNSDVIDEEFRYTLNIIAAVLTSKLKERRSKTNEKNMFEELDKGRELQQRILPLHEHRFLDYDIYGVTVPAKIIGGDFFDYLEIGEDKERLGITLGDAASKGVAAAAEAMYISGALRMATTFEIKIGAIMKRMNRLVNKIFGDEKFTSLFYGELSGDRRGAFSYANAGHNPPFMIKADTDEIIELLPTGPVLGPAPKLSFTVDTVFFKPGDFLCIFSDGVVEAADTNFEFYEEERLKKLLLKKKHLTPKEIAVSIIEDVAHFSKDGQYSDDMTVVIIKKNLPDTPSE